MKSVSKIVLELRRKMQYLPLLYDISKKYDSLLDSDYIHLSLTSDVSHLPQLWNVKKEATILCRTWNKRWGGMVRTSDSLASYKTVGNVATIEVDIVPAESGCTGDIDVLVVGLSSLCKSFYSLTKD